MKKLIPHLYFKGNCLEAINHYVYVFKGEIESFDKYKDQPIEVKEEDQNKIYFCHFLFTGLEIYASDSLEERDTSTHLWLHFDDEAEMEETAKKLADKPSIEISQSAFGEKFIKLTDPFGVEWTLIVKP